MLTTHTSVLLHILLFLANRDPLYSSNIFLEAKKFELDVLKNLKIRNVFQSPPSHRMQTSSPVGYSFGK